MADPGLLQWASACAAMSAPAKRAVAEFTTSGTHDPAGFTDAEGGEVVVKVELLGILGHQAIDDLLVTTRSQYAGY